MFRRNQDALAVIDEEPTPDAIQEQIARLPRRDGKTIKLTIAAVVVVIVVVVLVYLFVIDPTYIHPVSKK